MTSSAEQNSGGLRSLPPLLTTESSDALASMCDQVNQEINPTGVIERMYVDDVINLTWDILRLRRIKTAILNGAFLAALQGILEQLLDRSASVAPFQHQQAAEDLASGFFETEKAKAKIATLLRKFGLDEGAVEAEAFRLRAEDLERLDRMLTLAEVRRDKALRCVADYRQILSKQLQQSTDRILDDDDVPRLVEVRKRPD